MKIAAVELCVLEPILMLCKQHRIGVAMPCQSYFIDVM